MRRVLILLAFLLAGCSGGGAGTVAHSDLDGAGPTTVVGRLYLGGDVAGATLRLEDGQGRVFATGVSNADGLVFFDDLRPPAAFRAVATVPGFAGDFRAEFQAFDPANRQARITLLTDLASRYRERNGTTLAEAEARVKSATRAPTASTWASVWWSRTRSSRTWRCCARRARTAAGRPGARRCWRRRPAAQDGATC